MQEEEEEAIIELAYTNHMVDVTSLALMQQCQQAVKSSVACCLALLMQGGTHGQHYCSTLRPQSKGQNGAALKTGGKCLRFCRQMCIGSTCNCVV